MPAVRALGGRCAAGLGAAAALAAPAVFSGCAAQPERPDTPEFRDVAPEQSDVRLHENPLGQDPGLPVVVEPRPGMANVRPHRFSTALPLRDGRLRVLFWGGVEPCFVLDHVDVRERPDTVEVTLYAGSDPASPDVACIELAVYMAVEVPLSSPLAKRVVLDGSVEDPGAGVPSLD